MSGNSMEAPSERVGGDQNDQIVQPSAVQNKKIRKHASDKKYRDTKKQKNEDTKRELETTKAEIARLENSNAFLKGQLDRLEKDVELNRETLSGQRQVIQQQNIMIDMLQKLLQRPFGRTPDNIFGTGEAALPVQHPPLYQFGTAMGSGGSTMQGLSGLHQSLDLQGWAHGNNSEQPSPTYNGQFVSLNHLNNNCLPGTAMESDGSAMQGSFVPQWQAHGNDSEQPSSTYNGQFVSLHHLNNNYLPKTTMGSGGSAMQGSFVLQGRPHGNNSEQPASTNDNQFF